MKNAVWVTNKCERDRFQLQALFFDVAGADNAQSRPGQGGSMELRTRLRHVLWIGGGTGAGESSVATLLADRHGLARYNYDWHDSRDHTNRTPADRPPNPAAVPAVSRDGRRVSRNPRQRSE